MSRSDAPPPRRQVAAREDDDGRMEMTESPIERYDGLILAGVLRLVDGGLAQWCFGCCTTLLLPEPAQISHAAIDELAEQYLEHCAVCFAGRTRRLPG